MTSGADSSPAVVVHGGRRSLAQGGSYPAPYALRPGRCAARGDRPADG
ncbi:hypothetical protein ACPA9J_20295 [Pseudomonas aeruginosa]